MTIQDTQSGPQAPRVLHTHNTPPQPLSPFNNPLQFSDASSFQSVNHSDPRHLIAIMIQTRRQCRKAGLIKRDHTELRHIASTLGISPAHTRQIITLMQSSPADTTLQLHHIQALSTIPIRPIQTPVQKKTRIPIRALMGLSIWAITIVVAMQMVQQAG